MTKEQNQFIVSVLSQITINAADPNAIQTSEMVQSILKALNEPLTKN